jgi:hypothetical protein
MKNPEETLCCFFYYYDQCRGGNTKKKNLFLHDFFSRNIGCTSPKSTQENEARQTFSRGLVHINKSMVCYVSKVVVKQNKFNLNMNYIPFVFVVKGYECFLPQDRTCSRWITRVTSLRAYLVPLSWDVCRGSSVSRILIIAVFFILAF